MKPGGWRSLGLACLHLIGGGILALTLQAQEPSVVLLPPPQTAGGKPLLEALRERRTTREFSSARLSLQQLSNLLWAAHGVNRPASGHRTAPSAMNSQEIDLYVATSEGLFLFQAAVHQLRLVLPDDIRARTGGQDFTKQAPVSIIFVADHERMTRARPDQKDFYAAVDTGYISQNIYLFCASEGLGTVVHDLDRAVLAKAMQLRPDQRIVLAQAVGFPKPAADPLDAAQPSP